ncbi:hypothetical protein QRD43_21220 [Pelomonas sp. APW6]|uniref:Uncharacterized protein n=1 Tax=Roseateles subflavus TaxID=3053353 RepID=A0ABT7LNI2_9BURK|nr:hypothetical protein [Pelomonas sp. APW6]MDL5034438.1 hypothetical protein [Pelomonas sp. APW6]
MKPISPALAALAISAILIFPSVVVASPGAPAPQSIAAAQAKVAQWMKPVEIEHARIAVAFEKHDVVYLERAEKRMASAPGLPGGDLLMQDEYAPFLKCDTAARDLAILVGAMSRYLARPSDALRKIVSLEQDDYDRSSAACRRRLSMKPQEAWAAYDAE